MGRFEPLEQPPPPPRGLFGAICAACGNNTDLGVRFCTSCNVLRSDAEHGHSPRYAASRVARFMGAVSDGLIPAVIGLVLGLASLGDVLALELWVGSLVWLVWFAYLARRGQTPGKQIVSTKVIRADGASASRKLMWAREVGYRVAVNAPTLLIAELSPESAVGSIIIFLIAIVVLADAVAIFFSRDRQTLHDRVFGTLVVNVRGVRQTSAELRAL
ncbi:MAG: RDD family protein [Chloroflexi bacterium]|nr:RDD family protein [Chloroflexota bacterium]